MALTEVQNEIYEQILVHVKATRSRQIVYSSQWLGWLPYPVSHWIDDCNGEDISRHFLRGWEGADISALESEGLLRKVSEWQNPDDKFDRKITYEVLEVRPDR